MVTRAGKLDTRIALLRRDDTPGEAGGRVTTWETLATVWGSWELMGREQDGQSGPFSATRCEVRIRYRADLTTADRLQVNGQTFQLTGIKPEGRRAFLLLQGDEVRDGA